MAMLRHREGDGSRGDSGIQHEVRQRGLHATSNVCDACRGRVAEARTLQRGRSGSGKLQRPRLAALQGRRRGSPQGAGSVLLALTCERCVQLCQLCVHQWPQRRVAEAQPFGDLRSTQGGMAARTVSPTAHRLAVSCAV